MIDTQFYSQCIGGLEKAYATLQKVQPDDAFYILCRDRCIVEFERVLEHSGKLLRKCLKKWFHSPKAADALTYKDVFRHAAHHGLISLEEAERWLLYRDNRKTPRHNDRECFAEKTLPLLPDCIRDAIALQQVIANCSDD